MQSRGVHVSNGLRGRKSVLSLGETRRKINFCRIMISVSLLGSRYYSQYIFLSTQSWMTVHLLAMYRDKHCICHWIYRRVTCCMRFYRCCWISNLPKLLSCHQGQIAVIIHFERNISQLSPADVTVPLVEGCRWHCWGKNEIISLSDSWHLQL